MVDASVLHEPKARETLLHGANVMAGALRPTLGPVGGTVAISSINRVAPPEVLANGATIAKRMISLDDRFVNMGAMVIRELVERVADEVGDGTATAAVMAAKLLESAVKYVAADGDVAAMRRGLDTALAEALEQLRRQAQPVSSPRELSRMFAQQVDDRELGSMIAEVLESVGSAGTILLKDSQRVESTHEYVEGMRWSEGTFSSLFLDSETMIGQAIEPRILVTDHILSEASQLAAVLEDCVRRKAKSLVVIAPEIKGSALGLLVVNKQRGVLDTILAVKAPSRGRHQLDFLEDIAVVTGAQYIRRELGWDLRNVTVTELGSARQVWVSRTAAGIVGGRGELAAIRDRLRAANHDLREAQDEDSKAKCRERIGNLTGLTAIIRVGGHTKNQRASRRLKFESAVTSGRLAMQNGVVPGGGAALRWCAAAIDALSMPPDETVGAAILRDALEEPSRAIMQNAGIEASNILAQAAYPESVRVFDVLERKWVSPWECGIVDPLPVLETVLRSIVSAVSTAITTDVLIRQKR